MTITLKSGKKLYANHGIIGLTPYGNEVDGCRLTEGYDSPIFVVGLNNELNNEDLHEIADMMIDRWLAFKGELPPLNK